MKIKIKYSFLVLILISIVACSFTSNSNNKNIKKRNFFVEQIYFKNDSISVFYDLDSIQIKPTEKQKEKLKNTLYIVSKLNDTIKIALYNDYKKAYPYYIEGANYNSNKLSKNDFEELFPNPLKIKKILNKYNLACIYIPQEIEIDSNSYKVSYQFESDVEHEFIIEVENDKIKNIYGNV